MSSGDAVTRPLSVAVLSERLDMTNRVVIETKCAVENLTGRYGEFITSYSTAHTKLESSDTGAHRRIDKVEIRLDKLEAAIDGMERSVDRLIESNKQLGLDLSKLTKFLVWIGSGIGVLVLSLLWQIFTGEIVLIP